MSHGMAAPRLRSLTLLLAFGIGLLGQIVAAVAMPMPMPMPQDTVASGSSTAHAGACPTCPRQQEMPAPPIMTPACLLAFCSVPPAVLPAGPIVAHFAPATFQAAALHTDLGITLRPDLGPPRPILDI